MSARQTAWYRWALVVTVLVVMVGWGLSLARAQQAPSPTGPCARPQGLLSGEDREAIGRIFLQRVKERLGLTDQQAEQVRTILQSQKNEARAKVQALCEARIALRQLLDRQDSDPAALKTAGDRVKTLQGKLLDQKLDTAIALRSQLTPEQWAKWIELRKAKGHRRMGKGRPFAS